MIIKKVDLQTDRYIISTKIYLPENMEVKGVILGIHGFAGDKESSALYAVAERGVTEGKALACFDLPSHGESPVNEEWFSMENCLKDVIFMADYIRKQFPKTDKYCFATSFGGFLTLLAADQLKDFVIVLRAPAVTMPQHIFLDLLHMTAEELYDAGSVNAGFERPLAVDYHFYEELIQYDVLKKNYNQEMLVIHGNADDVVPHTDILAFCAEHSKMTLVVVEGADHRFKKSGELEQVVDAAFKFWNN